MGNNPFISHRMFVAALNNDHHRPVAPDNGAPVARTTEPRFALPPRHLTVDQFAALAGRNWSEFPMSHGVATSAW